jgi:AraC-like DNA-binding protein
MIPLPVDPRALAVAMRILGSPADGVSLTALARQFGVGARTIERLFRAETGMPFGLWRQKARLLESVRVLVESKSVTRGARIRILQCDLIYCRFQADVRVDAAECLELRVHPRGLNQL